jgi:hypothetical protein
MQPRASLSPPPFFGLHLGVPLGGNSEEHGVQFPGAGTPADAPPPPFPLLTSNASPRWTALSPRSALWQVRGVAPLGPAPLLRRAKQTVCVRHSSCPPAPLPSPPPTCSLGWLQHRPRGHHPHRFQQRVGGCHFHGVYSPPHSARTAPPHSAQAALQGARRNSTPTLGRHAPCVA